MLFMSNYGIRLLVESWLRFNKSGVYPYPGGVLEQTQFCVEVFDHLSMELYNHNNKLQHKTSESVKKQLKDKSNKRK